MGNGIFYMWLYDRVCIFLNMPKSKTPKKGFKSSNDVTKEIKKVWEEHKKKEKENGMVRE